MRAAVTGGAGFIGSHVVDALIARGDDVHVVDNLATGRRENLNGGATLHERDIREPLGPLFDELRPELVVHLAAQADVGTSVEQPVLDAQVNVLGTLNVLEAARPHGAQLVFSSTGGALYGECPRPAREDDERRPLSPYGTSKLAGEAYLGTWNALHGTNHVVLRFGNVYGPRQLAKLEGGVVAIFMDRLRAGENVRIFGDGEQERDFVYVGDVVDADPGLGRARGRGLQRRHGRADVGESALRDDSRRRRRRGGGRVRRGAPRRPSAQRPRRLARRARARLAAADVARGRASPHVGLRPAATLVAIRVAFLLGAAATLIWAPAPERRLIGDAYGPLSDFVFQSLSQWDARWFLQISLHGYEEVPQAAAFFPVYPALVHGLAWLTGSELVAGVLISLAGGAVAAWVLAQIARSVLGARGAHDVVLYFALYPVAFVLTSLYSEGLFLALASGSFLAAMRGRPLLAGVLGGFATGTRLIGLALLPALALLLWRGRDPRSLLGSRRSCCCRPPWACTRSTSTGRSAIRGPSRAPRPTGTATRLLSAPWRGSRTRSRRPAAGRATCSTCPRAGRGTSSGSGSGTSPTWRCSSPPSG